MSAWRAKPNSTKLHKVCRTYEPLPLGLLPEPERLEKIRGSPLRVSWLRWRNLDDTRPIELSVATRISAAIWSPGATGFRPNVATSRPFGRIHIRCKDGKDRLRRNGQ